MHRRDYIKKMGLTISGAMVVPSVFGKPFSINNYGNKPVTCICLGAGNRGSTYCGYALKYPEKMNVVGVAEPIDFRRNYFATTYNIPANQCYNSWEEVFKQPKFADVIIITTPDRMHYEPYVKALAMGYNVLVEKPMAATEDLCIDMVKRFKQTTSIVAVCHVLRYTPYFKKIKEVLDAGRLGQVMAINHFEPIGYWHMAHSYVRGNWRNSDLSSSIVLAKSSHDFDIIQWMIGKKCKQVSSFGELTYFKSENAPIGSAKRCVDCSVEAECPYSAIKLYLNMDRKGWPTSVITNDMSYEGRLQAIKDGPYGRCVFHCDNNVPDHQVTNLYFDGGVTVSFTLSAFSQSIGDRKTIINGTMGELMGDMHSLVYTSFKTGKTEQIEFNSGDVTAGGGHGGGDYGLMDNFLEAVAKKDQSLIVTSPIDSLDSHIMAFRTEESRLQNKTISINK